MYCLITSPGEPNSPGEAGGYHMGSNSAVVRWAILSLLIFVGQIPIFAQTDSIYRLPEGTRILLKMDVELSSRVATVNDTFTAAIARPVMIHDVVVLPVGTAVEGRVVGVERAAGARQAGRLDIVFESMRTANSKPVRIEGSMTKELVPDSSAKLNAMSVLGGGVIGGAIGALLRSASGALIGAGVGAGAGMGIALLKKGKEVRIREDEEFEIVLKKEAVLPVLDY